MTVTKLALKRLGFLVSSAVVTAVIAWVSGDYKDAAWFPVVYFVLTTVRDFLDKSIPNK